VRLVFCYFRPAPSIQADESPRRSVTATRCTSLASSPFSRFGARLKQSRVVAVTASPVNEEETTVAAPLHSRLEAFASKHSEVKMQLDISPFLLAPFLARFYCYRPSTTLPHSAPAHISIAPPPTASG
jgi:hypothetical protein